ncbi:LLM class flavin-dependent oxidoreductase [Janthinobacterium sp. 17J80-10]|uniref:LLM class flavin-dependent oxidoreductase n=1 Tax=Janthinobacterium sp. 17J80-10 TaxID=2497863 RepID=UPI0010057518|nr:LLM class flavin-dependent oxidoreductase [Janthinobacterium sp. 17J80-10]QAU35473.1 LLM class flavin-dependent oxidoreductase [Janthinobacterium sp. 17J80-10]
MPASPSLSVLDLSPIAEGSDAGQSLRNTLDLARHCERLGFRRYWLAEHHSMPGIASAATAVVIGHVAAGTSTIRVGAGGIMLPNHAPLVIAEQFGTLESLFPGRIDLGLGRAPGSDQATARALRRNLDSDPDQFPQDVQELMHYFDPVQAGQAVRAVPGAGLQVPIWILGSSLFGAQLAAELGLPYAFASHFAPAQMMQAIALYRARFRPSRHLQKPYVMLGLSVFAADSDEQARFIASSAQQAFVNLRSGHPTLLQPPVAGYVESLLPHQLAILEHTMSCSVIGGPDTVQRGIAAFLESTGADELMITSQIFSHGARLHSYALTAAAAGMRELQA